MDLDEVIDSYLNPLLDKVSKESNIIFLLVDLNMDLLKDDSHALANESFDSLSPHMFLAHIIQPPRATSNSKTLIGSIFSNILGQLLFQEKSLSQFLIIAHNSSTCLKFFVPLF